MKVLVTGTDGYIGAVLAPVLVERGHEVTGLDTGFYRDGWLGNDPPVFATQITKDIRQLTAADLAGYDAVVHLAELSNDPLGEHNRALTFEINHQGSVSLAKACKQAGVRRFVYTSSCSVYGVGSDDYKTEESATNPQTAYAECKVLVERDVAALAGDDFCPTFLRNATAYGASPRMRFDIVLNNLAGLAWTTGVIKMISDGTPWRPLVHILDISEAVSCVLDAPANVVRGQIFNVGDSEQNYRIREIAQIVAEVFPGCELTFGRNDGDNRSYRVSFDKIRAYLPEFRCRHDALSGARELYGFFERIRLTPEIFQSAPHTRLKQLTHLLATHRLDDRLFWIGR